jgi:hypothetical protein
MSPMPREVARFETATSCAVQRRLPRWNEGLALFLLLIAGPVTLTWIAGLVWFLWWLGDLL